MLRRCSSLAVVVVCGLAACPEIPTPPAEGEGEGEAGEGEGEAGEGEGEAGEGEGEAGEGEGEQPFDPDGSRFPLNGVGFASGTFVERPDAAFDGVVDQTADASTSTPIFLNLEDPPLLFREFDCELALRRIVVHAPTDAGFFSGAEGASNTGTVRVVGRRADDDRFNTIATLPVPAGSDAVIVFDPEALGAPTSSVAYGIEFEADDPRPGTVRVAEVELFGFCAGPSATIEWQATPFICSDVECVAAENPGGLERRTVTCARSTGGTASEAMCEGEKPSSTGDTCTLSCAQTLTFVGMREFTYDNDSGWLHEGNETRRAGPLPSAVAFGTSVGVIEGKPCSIPTENPLARFTAISCTQPDQPNAYCAFRCE